MQDSGLDRYYIPCSFVCVPCAKTERAIKEYVRLCYWVLDIQHLLLALQHRVHVGKSTFCRVCAARNELPSWAYRVSCGSEILYGYCSTLCPAFYTDMKSPNHSTFGMNSGASPEALSLLHAFISILFIDNPSCKC